MAKRGAYEIVLIITEWVCVWWLEVAMNTMEMDSLSISSPATRKPKKIKLYTGDVSMSDRWRMPLSVPR